MHGLRQYQVEAVNAVFEKLRSTKESTLAVLPTGAGKSHIISVLAGESAANGKRVLILQHRKELITQNMIKLQTAYPDLSVSALSAGLGQSDPGGDVLFAGVQTAASARFVESAEGDTKEFNHDLGHRDLILIDEAHRVPQIGGQFHDIFQQYPNARRVGVTATPYRTGFGSISGSDRQFDSIAYSAGMRGLCSEGYLCGFISRGAEAEIDLSSVGYSRGEFNASEAEEAAEKVVSQGVDEILSLAFDRRHIIVFASGVAHAQSVAFEFNERGVPAACVIGDMPAEWREEEIRRFKRGEARVLVNCSVLCEGFDSPWVDCVALMRATISPGLFVQMCGRGSRPLNGKSNCLLLDFGGNFGRHGFVEDVDGSNYDKSAADTVKGEPVTKVCPGPLCRAIVACAARTCPDCGHEFPKPKPKVSSGATKAGEARQTYLVNDMEFELWDRKETHSMKVTYGLGGYSDLSTWVCLEHKGFARQKAVEWWQQHSDHPCPSTVNEALAHISEIGIRQPIEVDVVKKDGEQWPRLENYKFSDDPELITTFGIPDEELPF